MQQERVHIFLTHLAKKKIISRDHNGNGSVSFHSKYSNWPVCIEEIKLPQCNVRVSGPKSHWSKQILQRNCI